MKCVWLGPGATGVKRAIRCTAAHRMLAHQKGKGNPCLSFVGKEFVGWDFFFFKIFYDQKSNICSSVEKFENTRIHLIVKAVLEQF